MKYILRCLMGCCCFLFFGINSFIYDIRVLRRWDSKKHHYKYFIGLGDFHDKKHEITDQQKQQIDFLLKKCPTNKTQILIEDISSDSCNGCRGCGKFVVHSQGGILGGLADKCLKNGLQNVDNVEYRFCRVASLAPVVNNIEADFHSFPSSCQINVSSLNREIDNLVKEIKSYNDGQFLRKWYNDSLVMVFKYMKALKMSQNAAYSVADYIASNTNKKNKLSFLKHLLTFDGVLLEAKMLHMIRNSENKDTVIAIAGGTHTGKVSDVLQKMGYELIFSSNTEFVSEYNLKKCLGCTTIRGKYCKKPKPADLVVLNRFL